MSRVLCSLFDKDAWQAAIKLLDASFAPQWVSTSSTAAYLRERGCQVMSLEEQGIKANYLGGKVKSLHPAVYAAIMADPTVSNSTGASEIKELEANNIVPFDAVLIDIYRLKSGSEFDCAQIDIGGPSALRAASKNYRNCLPICHPQTVSALLKNHPPRPKQTMRDWVAALPERTKRDCAIDVFQMMVDVNRSVALELSQGAGGATLSYGDNPGEAASICSRPFWVNQKRIEPIPLDDPGILRHPEDMKFSWNNVMDIHQALSLFRWLDAPCKVAIMKHHHTCGVGYDQSSIDAAFETAHACDQLSAFGGVVVTSQCPSPVFIDTLKGKFIDLLVIPNDNPEFFKVLVEQRPKQRVIALPTAIHGDVFNMQHHATVFGDVVVEKCRSLEKAMDDKTWTVYEGKYPLTDQARRAIKHAYGVVSHLHSNAIVVADGKGTLGIGVGFVNRVNAIAHAIAAAKKQTLHSPQGPLVLASDGFMPFADNIDATADVPLQYIVQPGGSKRDQDVIDACAARGITLVMTGARVFFHGI